MADLLKRKSAWILILSLFTDFHQNTTRDRKPRPSREITQNCTKVGISLRNSVKWGFWIYVYFGLILVKLMNKSEYEKLGVKV